MITKSEILNAYQQVQASWGEEREETAAQLEEWVKTLRSIDETLDDALATDYQMETVRKAIKGLIISQVAHYKKMMN